MTGTQKRTETLPIIHVHPLNDDREHVLDSSLKCWCKPKKTDFGHLGLRITHNSADGREFVERNLGELMDHDKKWDTTLIT